jgi:hypothetical protein
MDNLQLSQGGSFAFTSGALAAGTDAGTVKTVAIVTYTIDGQFKSKSITDNIAISYTGPAVYSQNSTIANGGFTGGPNGSTRLYGIYLDSAGAVSILPGQIVDTAQLAAGTASLQFPDVPKSVCAIGVMRVAVTANTTFVPGTTALAASGVTTSFINLSAMPGEPLTA